MESNFKEINYWLNKYQNFLDDDIIGKAYRYYNIVENINEFKFLIFVKENFYWIKYMNYLKETNSKLDSKICEYIADSVANFWQYASNSGVLSSEDIDKNKHKIFWYGIEQYLNESERIKYSEELKNRSIFYY
jgi:hypothetical protein